MENSLILFKRLLRFSGFFNITAAFLFMLPSIYKYYFDFYNYLNELLGLGGKLITHPSDPLHILLINTAGIDLVLIGSIILLVSKNPLNETNRKIIIANGIGRLLFFILIMYYSIFHDLIRVFIPLGVIDLFITIAFFYFLHKTAKK